MWSLNLGMMQARRSVAENIFSIDFEHARGSCVHGIAKSDYTETDLILDFGEFLRLFIFWFAAFSVQTAKHHEDHEVDAAIECVQFWEVVRKVSVKSKRKRRRHHLQFFFVLAVFIFSFSVGHLYEISRSFFRPFFFASWAHRYWFTYHQAHVSFVRKILLESIGIYIISLLAA